MTFKLVSKIEILSSHGADTRPPTIVFMLLGHCLRKTSLQGYSSFAPGQLRASTNISAGPIKKRLLSCGKVLQSSRNNTYLCAIGLLPYHIPTLRRVNSESIRDPEQEFDYGAHSRNVQNFEQLPPSPPVFCLCLFGIKSDSRDTNQMMEVPMRLLMTSEVHYCRSYEICKRSNHYRSSQNIYAL